VVNGNETSDRNVFGEWYPYSERPASLSGPLMPLPDELAGRIYMTAFVKRLIDDFLTQLQGVSIGDDILRLMRFLAYENIQFSELFLHELLTTIATCHISDVRGAMCMLAFLTVMIEDSHRDTRIFNAFRGTAMTYVHSYIYVVYE
jgi:hypothetical protein